MEEKEVVNVGELLNETIVEEIYNLGSLAPDGRKQAIEGIERLYKLRIEENKAVDDLYNNEQRIKMETERLKTERQNMAKDIEIKEEQLKSEKKKNVDGNRLSRCCSSSMGTDVIQGYEIRRNRIN